MSYDLRSSSMLGSSSIPQVMVLDIDYSDVEGDRKAQSSRHLRFHFFAFQTFATRFPSRRFICINFGTAEFHKSSAFLSQAHMPELSWQTPVLNNPVDAQSAAARKAVEVSASTQALIDQCTQESRRVPARSTESTGVEDFLDKLDNGVDVTRTCGLMRPTSLNRQSQDTPQDSQTALSRPASPQAEHRNKSPTPNNNRQSSAHRQSLSPGRIPLRQPPRHQSISPAPSPVPSRIPSSARDASIEVDKQKQKQKQKRAPMGPAERKSARKQSLEKQQALLQAITEALDEQEEKFEALAEEHEVGLERVKQLALHKAPIKDNRRTSDYNIAMHFKSLELNGGLPKNRRLMPDEVREALREDEVWQEALKSPERMQIWRDKFDDEKAEDAADVVGRVSTKAATQAASKSLVLLQNQCEYAYERSRVNTFGIMGRGFFDSKAQPAFFGCGPADGFLREKSGVSIQGFMNLWDSYVCEKEELGKKFLSVSKMNSESVQLILRSLREITGLHNVLMSYSQFDVKIVVAHKVKIVGWPVGVDFASPQTITKAEPAKILYEAWKSGTAYWRKLTASEHRAAARKADEESSAKSQKRRSDAGGTHKRKRLVSDGNDDNSDEMEGAPVKKKSKGKGVDERDAGKKKSKRRVEKTGSMKGKGAEPVASSSKHSESVASSSKRPTIGRAAKAGKGFISDGIADFDDGDSDDYIDADV
ncbi:hypothetical protein BDP27DRAFT_1427672 [Rhodocollybia butyracea]|uniref:Uncharacterized protein n=1 Tax=Rhodocollybia butyracea TaxID=206335 RepID=A0A9P5U1S0_9AGAR|nr:hypothetical protein BDP27DRAFT_1427672 [Rhodocollybia butyracea]